MRKLKLLPVLLAIVFLIGCASMQTAVKEDPYKASLYAYSKVLKWYTQSAETYEIHYQAADKTTQGKWKRDIDPVFKEIKKSLDAWDSALSVGNPSDDQLQQIKLLKSQLLAYGLTFLED